MNHAIEPMEDILVTVGAYEALYCAFQALIDEGDEVSDATKRFIICNLNDVSYDVFCSVCSVVAGDYHRTVL